MCSTTQIPNRLLELSFHSPGPVSDTFAFSKAFSHDKIFTGKILSGKFSIKNRDKQHQKLKKTPLYSHMTDLDLFLKAGLHFIYKLAMMQM